MANMKNLSSGTLYNGVSASATTLAVFCGNGSDTEVKSVWPTAPFLITVMPGVPVAGVPNSMDSEIMKVTAVGTDNLGNALLTVVRAQESTTAKAFEAGAVVTNGVYTSDMELPVASTSSRGIVQLSDSIISSSTQLAATANAVRKASGLRGGYSGNVVDKWCRFMRATISKSYKEYIIRFTLAATQSKRWGRDCYVRIYRGAEGIQVSDVMYVARNIGRNPNDYVAIDNLAAVKIDNNTIDFYWKTDSTSSAVAHMYSYVSLEPTDPTFGDYQMFHNDLHDALPDGDKCWATAGLPGEEVFLNSYPVSGSAGTVSIPVNFNRYSGYIVRGGMEPASGVALQEKKIAILNSSSAALNNIVLHDKKFIDGTFSTSCVENADTILPIQFNTRSHLAFEFSILSGYAGNYVCGFGKSVMNKYSHETSFRTGTVGSSLSKINIPYPDLANAGVVNVWGIVR